MEELRDKNGFIRLNINSNDQQIFRFKYKDKKYYFRVFKAIDEESSVYDELIGEELANDFNISHVHYDIAIVDNTPGVISEDFVKDNKYISSKKILENIYGEARNKNSINDIWDALEKYKINGRNLTRNEIKYLMDKIIDIFMFDILIGNTDRNATNFGLLVHNDKVDVAPIFDNEFILDSNVTADDGFNFFVDHESQCFDVTTLSKYFFQISSYEYLERFKEKIWIIDEDNIEKVFDRVEKRTKSKISENIKERYRRELGIIRNKINAMLNEIKSKKTL